MNLNEIPRNPKNLTWTNPGNATVLLTLVPTFKLLVSRIFQNKAVPRMKWAYQHAVVSGQKTHQLTQ